MENNHTKGSAADRNYHYTLMHERSILSTIIFNPEVLIDVIDQLKPHHFYLSAHQSIYEAMVKLNRSDLPIDETFLHQELSRVQKLDERVLVEVMTASPIGSIQPYIFEVLERFRKRELRKMAMQILKSEEEEKSSDVIIGEMESFIANVDDGFENMGKTFTQLMYEYDNSPPSPVYSTGVSFIDEGLNGGFEMGQLVLMSGDPEAGKTILTLQILKNVTKYAPAVMFAFEFTTRSLVKLQKKSDEKWVSDLDRTDNLILIDDGFDISDIERRIKWWKRKGARFFVIDSQMRIENANAAGYTMEERETEKFSRLAKLAHKEDLLIILIIQNSKADAAAQVISPMGSKKGAHEASIIMHLKRVKPSEDDKDKEKREFILNKNKQTGQHFIKPVNLNPFTLGFTRMYGEGGTSETRTYDGHRNGADIPVEHRNTSGQTTGQSTMNIIKDQLIEVTGDKSGQVSMPVI